MSVSSAEKLLRALSEGQPKDGNAMGTRSGSAAHASHAAGSASPRAEPKTAALSSSASASAKVAPVLDDEKRERNKIHARNTR